MGKKSKKKIASGELARVKALVFIPEHNSHGKKDVTYAFKPEAEEFARLCIDGSKVIAIDNRKPFANRRKQVLNAMSEHEGQGFDTVAFFCHGWEKGIQLGFSKGTVKKLAEAIVNLTDNDEVIVPLFCCSTGEDPDDDPITAAGTGDDSFADKLRDALCEYDATNCRVMGHTTVAHTTSNPMALFFDGLGSRFGGTGGMAPVSPKSKPWAAWKRALRDRKNNTLRLRFPFMTPGEIHEELIG